MKTPLATILRLVFATAGITFIAWSLAASWSDRVIAPAGTVISDEIILSQPTTFVILDGRVGPDGPQGTLVLESTQAIGDKPLRWTITADDLDQDDQSPQFRPGVMTTLRGARLGLLLVGLVMIGPIFVLQALRWWVLMRSRGLLVTLGRSFRLYMVGCFFNYAMPGLTGGDVVKAYYAAKGADRQADAVVSVVVDRIAGMIGLLVLACVAGLLTLNPGAPELARHVTLYFWVILAIGIVATWLYLSPSVRRLGSRRPWLTRIPGQRLIRTVDAALVAYRHHKLAVTAAVAISVVVHVLIMTAATVAGHALGMQTPVGLMLVIMPVVIAGGALPISPQGIGVMEALAMALLLDPPAATTIQIIGMLITLRLYQMVYSLIGALLLIGGDIHLHPGTSGQD